MKGVNIETVLKSTTLFVICISPILANNQLPSSASFGWERIPALSIAEQIGGGAKRAIYYLNTLLDSCQNVEDLNGWLLFMGDYLSCDAQAELMPWKGSDLPSSSSSSLKQEEPEQHLERLSELCAAWLRKRKCSSRLAAKLDSCLGLELEDGRVGTNALRLADAHMGFICRQKSVYLQNLTPTNSRDEVLSAENRPLICFHEVEGIVRQCIKNEIVKRDNFASFCQQFHLAKECLLTAYQYCEHPNAKRFIHTMLKQLQIDLKC
ncbi:unnamed protein product [Orchesella dallaii]|uniref:Secreted protein n=1 Tax=Orchesella dallaii TaxID=48710 RepID=A0ABP1QN37_9HEXA